MNPAVQRLTEEVIALHAYLVTAHQPDQHLRRLVDRLKITGTVYLHVDAKVAIEPFCDLDAVLIPDRMVIRYPTVSMTRAVLNLARRALADGATRFTLLRQQHYPIVSDARLIELSYNTTTDFIAAHSAPDASRGKPVERFNRRASPFGVHGQLSYKIASGLIARLFPPLNWEQALDGRQLRAGSAYWSLTAPTVAGILDEVQRGGPQIDYFHLIPSPDESFWHTLAPRYSTSLDCRPISWSTWGDGQHPLPLDRDALIEAMADPAYLFAKKFTDANADLADWVEERTVAPTIVPEVVPAAAQLTMAAPPRVPASTSSASGTRPTGFDVRSSGSGHRHNPAPGRSRLLQSPR